MARNLLLLSGNAHPALAKAVATELGTQLVNAQIDKFPDSETRVEIHDNVREQDVFVIQPIAAPVNDHLMELLIIIDALQRASAGRITAVVPYFGYARQDRKDASRVPITARLAANLYESAGADRLLAVDLHSAQIQGFTNKPFDHLYARGTMIKTLKREVVAKSKTEPIVVAPDVGAAKMARSWATRLGTPLAIVDKDRQDAHNTKVSAIIGDDIAGRTAIIVDDMITTGGSLLKAAEALKAAGAAHVIAATTHGVLCDNATGRINASTALDHVYITDTLPELESSPKITRVSVAPLLAQAIANVHEGTSVSDLF